MTQLEQITKGIYVSKGTKAISVKPTEIVIGKYFMPGTLGHAEHEDIGARLVEAAREQGQWVGMDYCSLGKQLAAELRDMIADNEKRIAESKNKGSLLELPISVLLAKAYKGITSLLGRKQLVVETAQPKAEQPKTLQSILTFLLLTQGAYGPAILNSEIREMADKGYLDLVEQGDQTILVPTQKLAETVYKAQQPES